MQLYNKLTVITTPRVVDGALAPHQSLLLMDFLVLLRGINCNVPLTKRSKAKMQKRKMRKAVE